MTQLTFSWLINVLTSCIYLYIPYGLFNDTLGCLDCLVSKSLIIVKEKQNNNNNTESFEMF
jgi:hypothetical protein